MSEVQSTVNPIQEETTDILPTEKSEIKRCFELLEQGDQIIQSGPKEVTLVIGITGSGKTTLVQFLAGDNSKLVSKEAGKDVGDFTIQDAGQKISVNSTIVSQTIFPDLTIDAETNTAFYDCPGFSDTRGTAIDIAGTYFIRKIIQNTKKVKILMTVNYSSMRKGGDRGDFMNLVKHTLNLIEKFDKYANSIALVVTKVENVYRKEGKNLVLSSDESVVNYVAQFLTACQKDAGKVFADEMATKARRLIEILSAKSDAGGYERIGIFRRPDEAGPLNTIQLLQDGKTRIKEIIAKNLSYTNVSVDDFGYAISEKSKNGIYEMIREINSNISGHVNEVGLQVSRYLRMKETTSTDVRKMHEEFLSAREKMRNIFDADEVSPSLSEFVKKLLNFVYQLHTNVGKDHVFDILQQKKYLEFLEVVGQRKIEDSSMLWRTGLSATRKYLDDSVTWYNFLSILQDKLSSYELQKNKYEFAPLLQNEIVDHNDKNLKQFVENHCKEILFDDISKLNVDDVKLKTLNLLLKSTLSLNVVSKYDDYSSTYEIRGDYIKLSDVDKSLLQKAKFLNIFAANKVFIDQDLVNNKRGLHHVAILAPTWEVIGEKKIELNGADGCCTVLSPANDGQSRGDKGRDGIPGKPGKPAGDFFGVGARFINGNNLVINANGGAGSAGQDGGKGAPGYDGRSPRNGEDDREFRKSYKGGSIFWIFRDYCLYGEGGGNGGRGGDGGVGGEGGTAGDIKLISLVEPSNVLSHSATGKNGRNGAGGSGGRRGWSGKSIKAEKFLWMWYSSWFSGDCSEDDYLRNGAAGNDGISGGNSDPVEHAETIAAANRSGIVNLYKEFLRASSTTETTQRAKQIEFLNQLNENTSIADLYNTLELVNDFIGLENVVLISKNKSDFLPAYRQLLYRVEAYAAKPSNQMENKRVLSTLYTAVLSKISVTVDKPQHTLFMDMGKYLDSIINDIKDERFMKDEYYEAYAEEIRKMIEDADSYIKMYITPYTDGISKLVQQNVLSLVREIVDAKTADNSQTDDVRKELEHNLIIMKMAEGPKKVARFLNFATMKAREIVARPTPVSRYLILENTAEKVVSEKLSTAQTNVAENDVTDLKQFLVYITRQLTNNSTNIPANEMAKVKDYQNQVENTNDKKLNKIEKGLTTLLDNMIQKNGTTPVGPLDSLLRIRNVMRIHDAGIKDSTSIADNERIEILVDAINKANIYSTQIQFYTEKLDDLLTGLMKATDSDDAVDITQESPQLTVRSGINDLKLLLQKTKDGFNLPEYLVTLFERIEEGLNSIAHVYDHLKYYTHVSRLAANIKNIKHNRKAGLLQAKLQQALSSLNSILECNVQIALYQEAIKTIEKFIFPFAGSYASTFELDLSDYEDPKSKILNKIQSIKSMVEKSGLSLDGKQDEHVYRGNFVRQNKDLGPFYKWKNEDYKDTISAFLNGKKVFLKADAAEGVSKHALKFGGIGISLRSSDENVQMQLDTDLRAYRLTLTHLGDSVYRCGNDFYVFTCEKQPITYSFAKNEKGEPLYANNVYSKLKNGDFILSPYAFWSAQLIGPTFDKLKRYENLVDIELEGEGRYIEDTSFCHSSLKNYYQVDNTISESMILEEDQVDLRDVYQTTTEDSHLLNNRKRRSVDNQPTSNNLYASAGERETSVPSKGNGVINWLVNKVSYVLPVNSDFTFNDNATPISHHTNAKYKDISPPNVQYNVNDGLLLTDLLIRTVTKAKPNFFHECAINYENVHHCAINIITEFENTLETMSQYDGEFDFDPVPLMSKLENAIINGNRSNVSKVLLDAVLNKSRFDEDVFYRRLEILTGHESK